MKKEIVNDLVEGKPTRAVQLPNGTWITEELARKKANNTPRGAFGHPIYGKGFAKM